MKFKIDLVLWAVARSIASLCHLMWVASNKIVESYFFLNIKKDLLITEITEEIKLVLFKTRRDRCTVPSRQD